MDSPQEALDYDAMDHEAVNRDFVDCLLARIGAQSWGDTCDVLDLGTGTAQIPIELCSRDHRFRVMATDLSSPMLDVAYANVNIAELNERVVLELQDSKSLPYESHRFHVVISNSIVHHVPKPQTVFAEALRMVVSDGLVLFRDLARPQDERTLGQFVDIDAADANDHQKEMFANSLRAALSLDEVRALVRELGCPPESVTMTSDRHWTWDLWSSERLGRYPALLASK